MISKTRSGEMLVEVTAVYLERSDCNLHQLEQLQEQTGIQSQVLQELLSWVKTRAPLPTGSQAPSTIMLQWMTPEHDPPGFLDIFDQTIFNQTRTGLYDSFHSWPGMRRCWLLPFQQQLWGVSLTSVELSWTGCDSPPRNTASTMTSRTCRPPLYLCRVPERRHSQVVDPGE